MSEQTNPAGETASDTYNRLIGEIASMDERLAQLVAEDADKSLIADWQSVRDEAEIVARGIFLTHKLGQQAAQNTENE